jgi:hypothetical protein
LLGDARVRQRQQFDPRFVIIYHRRKAHLIIYCPPGGVK